MGTKDLTVMNKPLIEYQEIDIGHNEHLTYTQQYTLYRKWYIGYNSYWDNEHPFEYHSLFIDLDNVTPFELDKVLKFIKEYLKNETASIFDYIGFILKSSPNHYHIVIPHQFKFSVVISLLLRLYEMTKKESIFNYMVNSINRYFCTFRLSQKDNSVISGYRQFIIFLTKNNKYYPVNYYHWELMKTFFKNDPMVLGLMLLQEKSLVILRNNINRNFITYYGEKTNVDNGSSSTGKNR